MADHSASSQGPNRPPLALGGAWAGHSYRGSRVQGAGPSKCPRHTLSHPGNLDPDRGAGLEPGRRPWEARGARIPGGLGPWDAGDAGPLGGAARRGWSHHTPQPTTRNPRGRRAWSQGAEGRR